MQFSSLALLAAGALGVTATGNRGTHGHPGNSWVQDFDNLVTFGDSYTDENRLLYWLSHNGTYPPPGLLLPPSNATAGGGVTWARFVSDNTGAELFNYAVSGAFGPFPDVVYETESFIADVKYINKTTHTNTLYKNRRADNTVYSMWIGTNDLGVAAFLTDSNLHDTTITDYVDCIFDRYDQIYKEGGRYFVLMNTVPLELTPLYGMPDAGGLTTSHYWPDKWSNITETSEKIREYTHLVNNLFSYRTPYELHIAQRYPGASFAIFDVHSLISDIYHNPAPYLVSPANVTGQYYKCDAATGTVCTAQSDVGADHFLWYDELHPSQQTDKSIAKEFAKVVAGSSEYATYW
ncbi:carbohydrate esterase family 16 protein [Oidiodendron maius Zn]|uniref:Carbohydrate esterase family 16 protein n=1 Tax=Oidiodendron maius (strain Zn) TaxID=913774 RepID=A0A0C3H9W7_OIDMZ|nr:carbohydrate esterase family 16 protein [Oidiodendron maius Zn]